MIAARRGVVASLLLSVVLSTGAAFAANPVEVEFWNSVKDTKSAAELQAYLDKYPSGEFAPLARIRLKALQTPTPAPSTAPTPPAKTASPPTPQASAAPFNPTSAETLREVHERLYNLNYKLSGAFAGNTDALKSAIKSWQSKTQQSETGQVTQDGLALLRRAPAIPNWGGLAYAAAGASGGIWNVKSRGEAEKRALEICQQNSKGGQCNVLTVARQGCVAIVHARYTQGNKEVTAMYAASRETLADAKTTVVADCRAKAGSSAKCDVRNQLCADGSHK